MKLDLPTSIASGYKSRSQIARVVTEAWGESTLYCLSCSSNRVCRTPNNTRASDFVCNDCQSLYQLKAAKRVPTNKVLDGAYHAMMDAVLGDQCPTFLFLHYSDRWRVQNLFAVPSFCMTPSAIERRKTLPPTARRAGWIGCNILLKRLPPDSRLWLVRSGEPTSPSSVRHGFNQLAHLRSVPVDARTWTLDILTCIREVGKKRFELADIYAFEERLSALHPNNKHVKPKIRQKLQVLRDMGIVKFLGRGHYELV